MVLRVRESRGGREALKSVGRSEARGVGAFAIGVRQGAGLFCLHSFGGSSMSRAALRAIALAAMLVAVLSGCRTTETKLYPPPGEPKPIWVNTRMQPTDGMVSFVGIATAVNVLDEAHGRRIALENAAAEVAKCVNSKVSSSVQRTTMRTGAVYKPGGKASRQTATLAKVSASAIIHDLKAKQYYYEKWSVGQGLFGKPMVRYKYYVLAELPEEKYKALLRKAAGKSLDDE